MLARDEAGYANLIKIATAAYLEGYYYKPRADWELLERHNAGLICLTGCMSGRASMLLREGNDAEALAEIERLVELFGRENVYVELQDAGIAEQRVLVPSSPCWRARRVSRRWPPTTSTTCATKTPAPRTRSSASRRSACWTSPRPRPACDTEEFYLKTAAEMRELFADYPEACDTTLEIAERCNAELAFGRILLPRYPVPDGRAEDEYLLELCQAGIHRRYGADPGPDVNERLEFELQTIREMGFSAYFLIVWDFVKFAKDAGIAVGPGRGSAAGSIVAYSLGITDIDPLKYDLLFERFLNPGRKSMPDIDMDFSVERRDEVIEYVARKYGRDHVAQIITFGTMAARAATRDAARVLGMPYAIGDRIAKMIPEQAPPATFKQAHGARQRAQARPTTTTSRSRQVVDLAQALEGLIRNDSIHAAGVVISDEPLTEYIPLQQKGDAEVVTQFGMDDVAALGLLKMDFLGLRNLDVIEAALELIEHSQGVCIDMTDVAARRREDLRDAGPRRFHRRVPVRKQRHERGPARDRPHTSSKTSSPSSRSTGRGPCSTSRPTPATRKIPALGRLRPRGACGRSSSPPTA